MAAYRYGTTLVDAERGEPGTVVLCGQAHDAAVRVREHDWVVLTPGAGYEAWTDTHCREDFEEGSIRDQARLDERLRTCAVRT